MSCHWLSFPVNPASCGASLQLLPVGLPFSFYTSVINEEFDHNVILEFLDCIPFFFYSSLNPTLNPLRLPVLLLYWFSFLPLLALWTLEPNLRTEVERREFTFVKLTRQTGPLHGDSIDGVWIYWAHFIRKFSKKKLQKREVKTSTIIINNWGLKTIKDGLSERKRRDFPAILNQPRGSVYK